VHAFSVNGKLDVSTIDERNEIGERKATLACFDELIRGAHAVQVRECTLVAAAAILFVSSKLSVKPDVPNIDEETGECIPHVGPPCALLVVDDWLRFRVPLRAVAQITCLRLRLHRAFAARVEKPRERLPADLFDAVGAIGVVLADAETAFVDSTVSFARRQYGGQGRTGGRGPSGRGGRGGAGRKRSIPAPRSTR
jgi:hypothetical protein